LLLERAPVSDPFKRSWVLSTVKTNFDLRNLFNPGEKT
jgi:hypothetical protein